MSTLLAKLYLKEYSVVFPMKGKLEEMRMSEMTLESSIADRLDMLSPLKPSDRDAFINHLTILGRAEIKNDHPTLLVAISKVAADFKMTDDTLVRDTTANITRWSRIHGYRPRVATSD